MTIQVLNGPNLGRLGLREPEKYGTTTYAELVDLVQATGREMGVEVQVRQTDDEGEMLRWVHAASDAGDPVLINPRWLVAHLRGAARRPGRAQRPAGRGAHHEHPRA